MTIELGFDPFYTADMRFREDQFQATVASKSDAVSIPGLAEGLQLRLSNRHAKSGVNDTATLHFSNVTVGPCVPRRLHRMTLVVAAVVSEKAMPDDLLFVRANLIYATQAGDAQADPFWDSVSIVQPKLELLSWVEPHTVRLEAGDSARLIVMVRHALDSTAPAFDLVLRDSSNEHMALQGETRTCAPRCTATAPGLLYNASSSGRQMWRLPRLLLGEELYQEWNVTILQSAPTGLRLKALFSGSYDTHPRDAGAPPRLSSLTDVHGVAQPALEAQQTVDIKHGALASAFQQSSLFAGVAAPAAGDTFGLRHSRGPALVPDEVAAWAFQLSLPPSTAHVVLEIRLPSFLRALSTIVLSVGDCFNNTRAVPQDATLGEIRSSGTAVTFDFGMAVQRTIDCPAPHVANASIVPNASAQPNASITVGVEALLDPGRIDGDELRNQMHTIMARLLYNGQYQDADVAFVLREPRLVASDPLALGRVHDAGDVAHFALRVAHDSLASSPAYNVSLTYIVDPRLMQMNRSLQACVVSKNVFLQLPLSNATQCHRLTPLTVLANGYVFYLDVLDPDDVVVLSFAAQVVQQVFPQDVLVNDVTVRHDSSPAAPPYEGKRYTLATSFPTLIREPVSAMVEVASSDVNTEPLSLTPEETITVNVTVQLPEADMDHAVLRILTPDHMDFLDITVVHVGSQIVGSRLAVGQAGNSSFVRVLQQSPGSTAAVLTLDCGSLRMVYDNVAALEDTYVMQLTLQMRVDEENNLGDARRIRLEMLWDAMGEARSYVRFHAMHVAEPLLRAHVAQPDASLDGDDILAYTAHVEHIAESNAAAYRVAAAVTIPPALVLLEDSIMPRMCIGGGALASPASVVRVNATSFVIFADTMLPSHVAGGHVLAACFAVDYNARVVDTVRANEPFSSHVGVNWTSTPKDSPWPGRQRVGDYSGGAPLFLGARHETTDTVAQHAMEVSLVSTSLAETPGSSVNVGEEAVFRVCVTLPEAHAQVDVETCLPSGMSYINATVERIGGSLRKSLLMAEDRLPVGPSTTEACASFNFGPMENVPDNVESEGDIFCLDVAAVVDDM